MMQIPDVRKYGKEIAVAVLLLALLFTAILPDFDRRKLRNIEAAQKRQANVEATQAGRKEIEARENDLYPKIDQQAKEIKTRQRAIKKEAAAVPSITRKEIEDAINRTTQGDSTRLADLFRAAGYPCDVVER